MAKQIAIVGHLGEAIVAQWLQSQGWTVLAQRWHCRWGELDLIAQSGSVEVGAILQGRRYANADAVNPMPSQPTLAFVEVKTRQQENWDANGLLAITPKKQAKLWQAARLFLATAPHLADLACRFDVALVTYSPAPRLRSALGSVPEVGEGVGERAIAAQHPRTIVLGKPLYREGYRLTLATYLPHAFEGLEI
ncbi:YraN family protein [Trichothermofontia sp.]